MLEIHSGCLSEKSVVVVERGKNMSINLYLAEIRELKDNEIFQDKLKRVSEERQQRVHKCRSGKAQQQSLAAGLLLEKLLVSYECPSSVLDYRENGKPYLKGRQDLFFNLSHSGEFVLCAIGNQEMGVDIQKMQESQSRRKIQDAVAKRFFTKEEVYHIQSEDASVFYRYWTAKESYLKMTGLGMMQELDSFFVELSGQRIYDLEKPEREIFLREYFALPEYAITVCSQKNDFCESIENVSLL